MWEQLREHARATFCNAVATMPGKKTLMVDPSFRVLLDVISRGGGGKTFFDNQGIVQIHYVASAKTLSIATFESQLVFLLRPVPIYVKMMHDIVVACRRQTFLAAWLPQCNGVCTLEMERQGLKGLVREVDMPLHLIPTDELVWSLCWEAAFHDLYVHRDSSALTHVVQSLLHLESQGMTIGRITAFGTAAQQASVLLDAVRSCAAPSPSTSTPTFSFDHCILVDRMDDPISLLVTPLHYEGLLDAVLGMDHGAVDLDKSKRVLNDEFYASIRDVDFHELTSLLHTMSTNLKVEITDTKASPAVAAMLRKLSTLASTKHNLSLHVDLGRRITESSQRDFDAIQRCVAIEQMIMVGANVDTMMEEALFRDPPLELAKMLKLLCLQCLVEGGFKAKDLDWVQTQLCHTHGYGILPLLAHLASLKWLYVKKGMNNTGTWSWSTQKKRLNALVGGGNAAAIANDIVFMFPTIGYAPLSVRTVQVAVGQVTPSLNPLALSSSTSSSSSSTTFSATKRPDKPTTVLVYYIGGVTVAEIAAFRRLNRIQDQYVYVVATTAACNTARLLRDMGQGQA
ncbi:Aste57867_19626 [Aphanomyces stellatus]|uniref:Aste57867_19626 protein n=1 Tax=Aphanomyces stellatus TaxID=120398 RepID=A0A485LEV4_9STRA|nr:hypothetical protein As57867_019561 [Aphanomyces stellatus]VFT96326.1 Aste57867_19626 [Aphanomyces stellatus]